MTAFNNGRKVNLTAADILRAAGVETMKVTFIGIYREWQSEIPKSDECECEDIRSHWLGWIIPLGKKGEISDRCRCGKTTFEVTEAPWPTS